MFQAALASIVTTIEISTFNTLITIFATVFIATFAYVFNQAIGMKKELIEFKFQFQKHVQDDVERFATLETKVDTCKDTLTEIKDDGKEQNKKLDGLITHLMDKGK